MPWAEGRQRQPQHGHQHTKARATAAQTHHPTDPCARCGHPLGPLNSGLHYDHSDDGTHYIGFSHGAPCPTCRIRCNVRAGAIKGRAQQERKQQPASRQW